MDSNIDDISIVSAFGSGYAEFGWYFQRDSMDLDQLGFKVRLRKLRSIDSQCSTTGCFRHQIGIERQAVELTARKFIHCLGAPEPGERVVEPRGMDPCPRGRHGRLAVESESFDPLNSLGKCLARWNIVRCGRLGYPLAQFSFHFGSRGQTIN